VARLTGISGRQAVAAFRRAGYEVIRQRGSHVVLAREGSPNLVIPDHRAVAPFLLRAQMLRAGLTERQFRELLR